MRRVDPLEKTLMLGGIWEQEEKGTTEDEMAGWHHQLDGREFEWTPGVGDGQGGLTCCDSWGRKELDTTEQLNWTELNWEWYKKHIPWSESIEDQEKHKMLIISDIPILYSQAESIAFVLQASGMVPWSHLFML